MRAAWFERTGAPHDVLQVGELPTPEPGPGQVRVRVHVSGINPSDTKKRAGWGRYVKIEHSRIVPHIDGAGEVDAVGPGVTENRIGQKVWIFEAQRDGRAFGTAAEYVVVPGKSWLASTLGGRACRDNRSIPYQRVPKLLAELSLVRADGRRRRLMRGRLPPPLLILDDLSLEPLVAVDATICWMSWKTATDGVPRSPPAKCRSNTGTS